MEGSKPVMEIERRWIEKNAIKFDGFEDAEIEKETEKAVLIQGNWIPKSVVEFIDYSEITDQVAEIADLDNSKIKEIQQHAIQKYQRANDRNIVLNVPEQDYFANKFAVDYYNREVK